ncbi:uncharacterized protein LOC114753225 [Neltuma alba]|uniref:uncharacterized protein LOC114753225 n=1 Tax=Neltuma alba TaxID=207710 RepID=UPI0010A48113|nr:uncharacterized protein LOC114753225 [Prosopis alba]
MGLLRFGVLALLLCFALTGSGATSSRSAEEYWHSIWPDTPLPKNLEYLLESGVTDAKNKDTQYPYTSFFEDDLHPGKQMNMIFNSPYANDAMHKDANKASSSQPWGVGSWKRNMMNEDLEKSSVSQPWGFGSWKRNIMNEDSEKSSVSQPWGVGSWQRNTNEESEKSSLFSQPWGVGSWQRNTNENSEKSSYLLNPGVLIHGKET